MATDFAAGCFGGVAGVVIGHPFDTVKVRMQSTVQYKGVIQCFVQIAHKESLKGYFKGMASPLASLAFTNALLFGVEANARRWLGIPHTPTGIFITGSIAGALQTVITCPSELAKIRAQMYRVNASTVSQRSSITLRRGPFKWLRVKEGSSPEAILKVLREEGVRGCFRGIGVTFIRETPGYGIYFLMYDLLSNVLSRQYGLNRQDFLVSGVSGGISGALSWICVYPFDTVKTRVQAGVADHAGNKRSTGNIIRAIYNENGLRTFYRGCAFTAARAVPVNAAIFYFVELGRRMLQRVS